MKYEAQLQETIDDPKIDMRSFGCKTYDYASVWCSGHDPICLYVKAVVVTCMPGFAFQRLGLISHGVGGPPARPPWWRIL